MSDLTVIGVPTSAGAHFPGLEKAPAHFRRAGLVEQLADAGLIVRDLGDAPLALFQADPRQRGQQNLARVAAVARDVAERVARGWDGDGRLLVLGGDCSLAVGVVAGALQHVAGLGLLYFDGNVDLNTPQTSPSGAFDSMGVDLLGLGVSELSRIGPHYPLLPDERIVLFGYQPSGLNPDELPLLAARQMPSYSLAHLSADPRSADAAVALLEARCERFLVHFDVDVLDFSSFPVANIPHYGGLDLNEALVYLARFAASPRFGGLIVTEFNPDRDPSWELTPRFVSGIVEVLASRNA